MEALVAPEAPTRIAYRQARAAGATRHRDIALAIGISEGELIAAHVQPEAGADGLVATRLWGQWPALVAALESVGEVMALTRNVHCVHEKTGPYRHASAEGPAGREIGLVLGTEIDLRLFYSQWQHGFAVAETGERGLQRSLQFFDASGTAVHKVFARTGTDLAAWDRLIERFLAMNQQAGLSVSAAAAGSEEKPDADVDTTAFREQWASLRDTHHFHGLLRRHGLTRTQALRLAEPRFAQRVDAASAAHEVLQAAAAQGLSIMVFVGNPGAIQIHTGPVKRILRMGPWLNVMDPGFNLHLREDKVCAAWVVRKPTTDGLVTSLELFDDQGLAIAQFFGERKPGRPELGAWRRLAESLVADGQWQAQPDGCPTC